MRPTNANLITFMLTLVFSAHASAQHLHIHHGLTETLPTFTSGVHTGKHAVYEHDKFVAWMDAKGRLWVQLRDSGKPVGKAFTCFTVLPYYSSEKKTTPSRPIKVFQDPTAAFVIPAGGGKIRIKGKLVENIPFMAEYTFAGNTIRAAGGCEDGGIKPPTRFRLLTQFPATHSFPQGTPLEKIEAATRGMTLELTKKTAAKPGAKAVPGQKTSHPYSDTVRGFSGPYEAMTVIGVFVPRVLTFKPVGNEGSLGGYVYAGFPLWRGYAIQYVTQGKRINLSKNEAIVIID